MIIIGSRAAKHHFPDFRKPKDFDLIVTVGEFDKIRTGYTLKKAAHRNNKYRMIWDGCTYEFEVALPGTSAEAISQYYGGNPVLKDFRTSVFDYKAVFADPLVLLILKGTALKYGIDWLKHIRDFHFIKSRIENPALGMNEELNRIMTLRQQEVDSFHANNPIKLRNDKWWAGSNIDGIYTHESLHKATCIGDTPICYNVGHLDEHSFSEFSYDDQCKTVAEECFVIAMETIISQSIAAGLVYRDGNRYKYFSAAIEALVVELAPDWMRDFIISEYLYIACNQFDFFAKFQKSFDTLKLAKNNTRSEHEHIKQNLVARRPR